MKRCRHKWPAEELDVINAQLRLGARLLPAVGSVVCLEGRIKEQHIGKLWRVTNVAETAKGIAVFRYALIGSRVRVNGWLSGAELTRGVSYVFREGRPVYHCERLPRW